MGGIMMVIGLMVGISFALGYAIFSGSFVAIQLRDSQCLVTFVSGIFLALLMGAIGFADDYIKVVKKRNLGLTAKQKTFSALSNTPNKTAAYPPAELPTVMTL